MALLVACVGGLSESWSHSGRAVQVGWIHREGLGQWGSSSNRDPSKEARRWDRSRKLVRSHICLPAAAYVGQA